MIFTEGLKNSPDFSKVYKEGRSKANRYLVVYVRENGTDKNRLGISVSKKVGNSVVRHRLTRLIRESYRLNESAFARGLDIVIVVRVSAKEIGFHEAESALLHLGRIQKVLSGKEEVIK